MKMRSTRTVVMCMVIVGLSSLTHGVVLLDEQFDGDLSNWTVLDGGGVTAAAVSNGQLHLTATDPVTYSRTGVVSKDAYALPSGPTGKLIIDFYGTNVIDLPSGINSKSAPSYLVSQFKSASNVFEGWYNYIGIKGEDATYGDWVQWTGVSGSSYTDINIPNGTYGTILKHMIFVIDAANINIYIEDDYFENLTNPVAVYTTPTNSIFSSQWNGEVYVNLTTQENLSWFTATTVEDFDGVKVTAIPEPASVVLLGLTSLALFKRNKKS